MTTNMDDKELIAALRADIGGEIAWEDDPKAFIAILNQHRSNAADRLEALTASRAQTVTDEMVARFGEALCAEDPGDPLRCSGPKLDALARHVLSYVLRDEAAQLPARPVVKASLEMLRLMDDEIDKLSSKPDPVAKHNLAYYAAELRKRLSALEGEGQ